MKWKLKPVIEGAAALLALVAGPLSAQSAYPAPDPVLAPAERPVLTSPAWSGLREEGSAPRPVVGALLGGGAGLLAGGLVGAYVGGNDCEDEGNPDSCKGLEGVVTGAFVGYTIGTPVGAHLQNGRRGALHWSLLSSAAIGVVGLAALRAADVGGDAGTTGGQRAVVTGVALSVPVLQLVSSVVIEGRTGRP